MIRCELCGQDDAEHPWHGRHTDLIVCDRCLDRILDEHRGVTEP